MWPEVYFTSPIQLRLKLSSTSCGIFSAVKATLRNLFQTMDPSLKRREASSIASPQCITPRQMASMKDSIGASRTSSNFLPGQDYPSILLLWSVSRVPGNPTIYYSSPSSRVTSPPPAQDSPRHFGHAVQGILPTACLGYAPTV